MMAAVKAAIVQRGEADVECEQNECMCFSTIDMFKAGTNNGLKGFQPHAQRDQLLLDIKEIRGRAPA